MQQPSKLRVAMVTDFPLDAELLDGGVQSSTKYLADALAESGLVDLHVITFRNETSPRRPVENGYPIHVLPRQRLGAVTYWRKELRSLKECLAGIKPNVVHGQGGGVEGYLSVRSGYPSVVTFHGILRIDGTFKARFVDRLRIAHRSRITEDYCASHADHVVLISRYVEQVYGDLLGGSTHYIPNAISEDYYNLGHSEVPGRILFAGRIAKLKGVSTLIHAFALVRQRMDAELILAGSVGDTEYTASIQKLLEGKGLTTDVHLRGLLTEKQLREEFKKASMVVLPSLQENAPMVIQQAMACGIPVVASRVGGVPNLVNHGKTGLLVEAGREQELSEAIMNVLSDPCFRGRAGLEAKRMAEQFRASNVAKETVRVYEQASSRSLENCSRHGQEFRYPRAKH